MSTLPTGWSAATAGQLFGFVTSGSRGWAEHYSDTGALFVRIGNMRDQAIDLSLANTQRVQPPSGAEGARTALRPGDILVSITAELGRVAIVPADLGEAYVNQHIALARPIDGLCNEFLAWQLAGPGRRKLIAFQKGATKAGLGLDDIRRVEVRVAPLNEQRRIVTKLDEVFAQTRAARVRLERLPALIEKLKRAILAAAFRGDLTADWRAANPDVEPASALLLRLRAKRAGTSTARRSALLSDSPQNAALPSTWCWGRVDDFAELQLGQQRAPIHAASEHPLPYVRAANITWSGLDLDDVKQMGFPDPARYQLRYGDVLLSEASGSPSEVGKPAIWRDEIPGCCYQKTLLRARPLSAAVSSEWLYLTFLADALLGRFAQMAPGVGILHLTADRMFGWPVPIAPEVEQREIVARATSALAAVEALARSSSSTADRLARVEGALLAKAFRGELVPQDPADEPAAVLLERIRAATADAPAPTRRARGPAAAPYVVPPAITLAQAAESGPLFKHAHERQQRVATDAPALDLVVAALQQSDGRLTAAAVAEATGLDAAAVRQALKDLVAAGQIRTHGKARGTTYEWTA